MRTTIVAALAATLLSPMAMAQDNERPRRPQGMMERSPEDAAKIWTAHATAAAKQLELNGTQTAQFVKAYTATRQSLRETTRAAMREMRESQGGERAERPRPDRPERAERPGQGDRADDRPRGRRGAIGQRGGEGREAMQKIADAERAKLKTTLATFLDDAKLDRAMTMVGNISGRGDRTIGTVLALELEPAKTDQALAAVLEYMAAQPTRADMAELDREGMRDAMRDAREQFMANMETILSEDELKKFRESARQRRGGPRDGAGRGGRGQRGEREFELPPI